MEKKTAKQRLTTLVLLLVVFVAPLVGAYWIAHHYTQHPEAIKETTNYGNFVRPMLPTSEVTFKDAQGETVPQDFLQGKWTMVFLSEKTCQRMCERDLYKMRQVHTALGKDRDRVQRMMITPMDFVEPARLDKLLTETYQGTKHVYLDDANIQDLLQRQPKHPNLRKPCAFFIIDPQQNIMMSYPSDAPGKWMLKDLKHLLRASQVG